MTERVRFLCVEKGNRPPQVYVSCSPWSWSRSQNVCFQNRLRKEVACTQRACSLLPPDIRLLVPSKPFAMRTGALGGTLQVLNNHIIRSVTVTMDTAGCQQSSREARRESGFRQCSFQSSHNPGESNRRTIIVRTWGWDLLQ